MGNPPSSVPNIRFFPARLGSYYLCQRTDHMTDDAAVVIGETFYCPKHAKKILRMHGYSLAQIALLFAGRQP